MSPKLRAWKTQGMFLQLQPFIYIYIYIYILSSFGFSICFKPMEI